MRRIPELDAVRGIAAVVIILFHLRFMGRFPLMGTAVDLFFVLSGYLITTILLNTHRTEHALKNFYIRRALRIWPIYYLYFPLAILINRGIPRPQPLDGLANYLTYTQLIQHYWFATPPECSILFRHTWTLAIEEQFYLVWPLLVALTGRKYLWVAIAPLLIAPTFLRAWDFAGHLLMTRCDGLALGALLAAILFDRERFRRHLASFQTGFVVVVLLALSYPFWREPLLPTIVRSWPTSTPYLVAPSLNTFRVCVFHFGLVGLILGSAGHPRLGRLRDPRLCYLGQISYGLYLYHPLVFTAATLLHFRLGLHGSPAIDALKIAACVGFAAGSWRYVERPILAWKDRFTYRSEPLPDPIAGTGPANPLRGPRAAARPTAVHQRES